MEVPILVQRAAGGDIEAFSAITERFQHMAFGYALSLVRDFRDAEDVVQEAFVAAWFALPSLAEPAAFAGWLRAIVRHRAHRRLRRRGLPVTPLAAAEAVPAETVAVDRRLEQRPGLAHRPGGRRSAPPPGPSCLTVGQDLHGRRARDRHHDRHRDRRRDRRRAPEPGRSADPRTARAAGHPRPAPCRWC